MYSLQALWSQAREKCDVTTIIVSETHTCDQIWSYTGGSVTCVVRPDLQSTSGLQVLV
jgi:hypothetical protein